MRVGETGHRTALKKRRSEAMASRSTAFDDKFGELPAQQIEKAEHGLHLLLQAVSCAASAVAADADRAVVVHFQIPDFVVTQKIQYLFAQIGDDVGAAEIPETAPRAGDDHLAAALQMHLVVLVPEHPRALGRHFKLEPDPGDKAFLA